jgi:3-polyprenyl-4-hydroxybenzoate decarboxylase
MLKQVLNMAPKVVSSAPCQEVVWEGKDVDLAACRSSTAGRATWRR